MVKLFVILLVLLVNGGVSGQRRDPTPSLDLVNVPGDNPPFIPVKIGYPAQGPFNLALYLNYDNSWVYGGNSKSKKKNGAQKCFDEKHSSTFSFLDSINQKEDNNTQSSNQMAVDLLRVNNNEYDFRFGLIKNQCSKTKNSRYSGVFGLAPTKGHDNADLLTSLKQVDQPVVSFFLPSQYSQQQKGGIVFGAQTHPACSYNQRKKFGTSLSSNQWIFRLYCCNAFDNTAGATHLYDFDALESYNASFNMELEDIYGPARQVFSIYKMLGAKRLRNDSEQYYLDCDKLPNRSLAFDLQHETFINEYQFEAKHLVTPSPQDKSKCILNIRTGGSSATQWVFGKKFAERFCITLDYAQNRVSLGTVYDASNLGSN